MKNFFLLTAILFFTGVGAQAQITNNGATITVKDGAVLSVDGNFDNNNSGIVQGDGQITMISGQFNNNAELSPGLSLGLIDITGPVVQAASGSKTIEVGGNNGAGVDPDGHDQVSMITDLTLAGTLDVELVNTFDPSTGGPHGPYTIATYSGNLTGTYANVNWPTEMVDWGVDYGIVTPGEVVLFAKSDLTTVEALTPNIVSGSSAVAIIISAQSLNARESYGAIQLRLPKDPRFTFTYDPALTMVGFDTVNNADWTYDGSGAFHVFTFSGTLAGNSISKVGIMGNYDPEGTEGLTSFTAILVPNSGGDKAADNNIDVETLTYTPE